MDRLPFTRPSHLAAAVEAVRQAAQRHGVVALPTETFYGLAVDPRDGVAMARVFTLKGRPSDKALPVVAASVLQVSWFPRATLNFPPERSVLRTVLEVRYPFQVV